MKMNAAEVVLIAGRHGPGLGKAQVIEPGSLRRPSDARELHPFEPVGQIAAALDVADAYLLPVAAAL
jgi:hypothetical protein